MHADPDGEEFVRRLHADHAGALYGWARTRFPDPRDAEEVVAETLVKAWRHQDRYDPGSGSERTWLFAIARNAATDHYRRGRRHLHLVAEDAGPSQDVPVTADPADHVIEATLVTEALASLPDHHRTVLVEIFYEDLPATQVAVRNGIPAGTVKSRLYYGLRALRAALEERGVLR